MTPREAQDGPGGADGGSAVPVEGSERQAGAQGVTEEDRERAAVVVYAYEEGLESLEVLIAAELAEERAKARAPFLIRARECELQADVYDRLDKPKTARAFRVCAQRIRRAAGLAE